MIEVRQGHRLAVRRRGDGGVPLLLIHGFPCTSRIWSHNLVPLAEAGFDVVAPDLRGYGDSDFAPDDFYDLNAFNADLTGLFDMLGWERVVVAGHDLGAMVAIDMANRHPEWVDRLVILDDSMPDLGEAFAAAGIPPIRRKPAVFEYQRRQGHHADALVAELDTPEQRRRYVGEFYGHRLWSPPDAFDEEDLAFLTEPYGDAVEAACRLRRLRGRYGHPTAVGAGNDRPAGPAASPGAHRHRPGDDRRPHRAAVRARLPRSGRSVLGQGRLPLHALGAARDGQPRHCSFCGDLLVA